VRDGGGAGGGKGWSRGAPYGRCIVTGGCSRGAVDIEDAISGIGNAEDEGGGAKREGLIRLVERLLLPLDSLGIKGVGKVSREGAGWKGVTADGMTLTEWEDEGILEG